MSLKRIYRTHKYGQNTWRIQVSTFGWFWETIKKPTYYTVYEEFSTEAAAEQWIKQTIERREAQRNKKKVFKG